MLGQTPLADMPPPFRPPNPQHPLDATSVMCLHASQHDPHYATFLEDLEDNPHSLLNPEQAIVDTVPILCSTGNHSFTAIQMQIEEDPSTRHVSTELRQRHHVRRGDRVV